MLLAVDVGNTSTHLALHDGRHFVAGFRAKTDTFRSPDEYALMLQQLLGLRGLGLDAIDEMAVCCVVPQALAGLTGFSSTYLRGQAFVLQAGVPMPIEIAVDLPQEAGADRLANACAAYLRSGGPAVVVDFGTTINFDVVDGAGRYVGGVIAPGVAIASDALWQRTAKLPRVEVERPPTVCGHNTLDSIRSGLFYGHLGMVEGILGRLAEELGRRPYVIATGGYARLFGPATDWFDDIAPMITLEGLVAVARGAPWRRSAP